MAGWNVEYTDQFEVWWLTLSMDEAECCHRSGGAVGTGRSTAGSADGRHPDSFPSRQYEGASAASNLSARSLRLQSSTHGYLANGGNKEHRWQEWYQDFIPVADTLYDEHLEELRQQGETT
jgi:hypothetical protein